MTAKFSSPDGFTLRPQGGYSYKGKSIVHAMERDPFGYERRGSAWRVIGLPGKYKTLKEIKLVIDSHPEL